MRRPEPRRIPLPAPAVPGAAAAGDARGQLVEAFLAATAELSSEAAASLAGVRPQTIRNWRRRLPRWLKAGTARRLRAHLTGTAEMVPEAGFRMLFRRALRGAPEGR